MEYFIQVSIDSIAVASLYAILALGYNLLYNLNRFFDLAYAAYCVLGAYGYFFIAKIGLGFPATVLLTMCLVGTVALICEYFLYRNLRKRKSSPIVLMIASLGFLTVVQGILTLFFTSDVQVLSYKVGALRYGGVAVTYTQICMLVTAMIMYGLMWGILRKTKFGIQIRAVSDNEELAFTSKVRTAKIRIVGTIIASMIGASAGIFYGFDSSISPLMGFALLLKGIVASVISGLSIITSGSIGGLLLSISETAAVWFLSNEWKDVIAFIILLLVLLFRPKGILQK